MANEIKSARSGKMVWKLVTNDDASKEWKHTNYQSISQAKAANGLNAVTVKSGAELPAAA